MYPEDRVLVGVINRKTDFAIARDAHWYRIPRDRAPRWLDAEYLAFYFSRAFKTQNGGIHFFARNRGHELVHRRDLLPNEANHPRADQIYYKIQIGELQTKLPPITNPTARSLAFIYTTWDRFISAATIADLYSKADWYVERVYNVLRKEGILPERLWEEENPQRRIAELRVRCERGIVAATAMADASRGESSDALHLPVGETEADVQAGAATIRAAILAMGGPTLVDIALED